MKSRSQATPVAGLPFDATLLDALLGDAGIELLLVTSKHNIQYLTGGHRFFFHDYADAIGVSRYLPILIYPRGNAASSVYVANPMECYDRDLGKFWMTELDLSAWGTLDAARAAIAQIRRLGGRGRVGIEGAFLPADAHRSLRKAFANSELVEAHYPLERLRARKRPAELELLRGASERVVQAMLAVFAGARPGMTKQDLVEMLRREEVNRGLIFEYCLVTAGTSLSRAPSDQVLRQGDILSLDSGGNYRGYIGDLCRMGILGEPDAELVEYLAEIETIQQAARRPIRAATRGGEIFLEPQRIIARSANRAVLDFVAHGMGIVSHEAPRLTDHAPQRYEGCDANRPLQSGMVISIETTMTHPRRGFIKLEDTVVVTDGGCLAYGDDGRGWNRAGSP
jgi:Xaa-Pro aminopeptidase